jgi:hypothetical protein
MEFQYPQTLKLLNVLHPALQTNWETMMPLVSYLKLMPRNICYNTTNEVLCTWDGMNVMPPIFFSENVIALILKFTWMIHNSFAIMRLFFHIVSIIFDTVLPVLSKMLYTIVKFPASTLEHIMSGARTL